MTILTIDDRILPSSGLGLEVLRQENVEQQATQRAQAKALSDARVQTPACAEDMGQWRVLRYL